MSSHCLRIRGGLVRVVTLFAHTRWFGTCRHTVCAYEVVWYVSSYCLRIRGGLVHVVTLFAHTRWFGTCHHTVCAYEVV
ncbi:predicted protein [Ostreococcus lucimarinus CCE9901]|uniref:Uncharacterized protein n=1 Tax=Ostreococcus lucimarinus (strain CCE9901) TaxID=436017 RepID=A4RSH6_OSTLU|nr:predicted protein [Ostreococcus lucimarinus CCE9901]ABO94539.1 predicted protein [Ostreococcus lucimarinus CCE9901]|eukprot:XP_001416246.1 predicted protein [Ostreococcus lucimarinus CCE9901]